MIVWIASFPRSGNTFLRIVLHRLYGVRTSVVYDVDGVADRLGADLIGFQDRPSTIEGLRDAPSVHFVKTHRQRDELVDDRDQAICLVRDGRDSLVSWARLQSEADAGLFESELRRMITRDDERGTGGWGANVLSWLLPPAPQRVVLRYQDLVRDPRGAVERMIGQLLPDLQLIDSVPGDDVIPSFGELRRIDNRFFRRGVTGTHVDELPEELHRLFWSRPENVTAMRLLE